jgi:hypothetical protein
MSVLRKEMSLNSASIQDMIAGDVEAKLREATELTLSVKQLGEDRINELRETRDELLQQKAELISALESAKERNDELNEKVKAAEIRHEEESGRYEDPRVRDLEATVIQLRECNASLLVQAAAPWRVAWKTGVQVREEPALTANALRKKNNGDLINAVQVSNEWVQLVDEPGFMCTTREGKILLQKAASKESADLQDALQARHRLQEQLDRMMVEQEQLRSSGSDKETTLASQVKVLESERERLQQSLASLRASPEKSVVQTQSLDVDLEQGHCTSNGGRSGTLADLGCVDCHSMQVVDGALQRISSLMALRSDVRLGIFGIWLLCHAVYMVNMFYEYFLYSHFSSSSHS